MEKELKTNTDKPMEELKQIKAILDDFGISVLNNDFGKTRYQELLSKYSKKIQSAIQATREEIEARNLEFLKSILIANGNELTATFIVQPENYIVSVKDNFKDYSKTIKLHKVDSLTNKRER